MNKNEKVDALVDAENVGVGRLLVSFVIPLLGFVLCMYYTFKKEDEKSGLWYGIVASLGFLVNAILLF